MRYERIPAKGVHLDEEDLIVHLEQGENIRQSLSEILKEDAEFKGYIEVFKQRKDGTMQNFTYVIRSGKLERVYGKLP